MEPITNDAQTFRLARRDQAGAAPDKSSRAPSAMLIGIDPRLNADVLFALRSMGHGDDLVVADANFPTASVAATTSLGRSLRIDDTAPEVIRAVCSVMPIDTFETAAIACMQVVGDPAATPEVHRETNDIVQRAHRGGTTEATRMEPIERLAFYRRAASSYAVIQTSEPRLFGCFILRKGIIAPSGD